MLSYQEKRGQEALWERRVFFAFFGGVVDVGRKKVCFFYVRDFYMCRGGK
jgi:hypothetical protein